MNRDQLIKSNISLGLLFKLLSLSTVYITIPYLIQLLGNVNYGIWVTIFSVINILFFLDGGVSNGLRTKLAQSLSDGDIELSNKYVTAGYVTISSIALSFLIVGFLLIQNFKLNRFFEIETIIDEKQLKLVFIVVLISIVSNFILSQYKSLFFAIQKSRIVEFSVMLYQLFILLAILFGIYIAEDHLIYVAVVYGMTSFIIGLSFTFYFFKNHNLRISFEYFDRTKVKEILSLGFEFLVIQICMIVIFTSDNILTIKLLGPEEVAKYDTHYKLYHLFITFAVIMLDPYWSMFSDAYRKKDLVWIKQTLQKLNKYFVVLAFFLVLVTIGSKFLMSVWVGSKINHSFVLASFFALCTIIRIFGMIYMYFLNGIGKIRLQMWLYIFGALINIPLSVFFVKNYHLGSEGILLGTIFSILWLSILLPIQSFRLIKEAV